MHYMEELERRNANKEVVNSRGKPWFCGYSRNRREEHGQNTAVEKK